MVRESGDSKNSTSDNATGVEQNIPQEEIASKNGDSSTEKTDKREELTNYELNSKTVSTVSDSYQIKRLSIAVVIDQARLMATAGVTPVPDKFVEQQIAKITELVATAAGLDQKRGDVINVTAVNFMEAANEQLEPASTPVSEMILRQAGSFVNAAALIAAVALVIWFGVRPLMREMGKSEDVPQLALGSDVTIPNLANATNLLAVAPVRTEHSQPYDDLSELRRRMRVPAQNRLEQMIDMDEERVAAILKQWVHEAA